MTEQTARGGLKSSVKFVERFSQRAVGYPACLALRRLTPEQTEWQGLLLGPLENRTALSRAYSISKRPAYDLGPRYSQDVFDVSSCVSHRDLTDYVSKSDLCSERV